MSDGDSIAFIFLLDLLNYSFWSDNDVLFSVDFEGKSELSQKEFLLPARVG